MTTSPDTRPFRCAALLLSIALILTACGKTGLPRPPQETDAFSFSSTGLSAAGECLLVRGVVQGAIDMVDSILLELAPVDDAGNCPTCPFNAREWSEFRLDQLTLDPTSGAFSFTYCPTSPTNIYRWRLVGRNVHSSLPYVVTTPAIAVLPAQ